MRIRYRVAIAVALLALIGAGTWLVLRSPPEPVYDGKPLSYWISESDRLLMGSSLEHRQRVTSALVHIGTNALPTLSRMLRAQDSRFKLKVVELAEKQHILKFHFVPAQQLNYIACNALHLMGDQAVFAVPVLAEVYARDLIIASNHPPPPSPAAPNTSSKLLYNSAAWMLGTIPSILGSLGPAASNAIPALTLGLSSTNPNWRESALLALYDIHTRTVLELIKDLQDPNPGIREHVLLLIQKSGSSAEPALPALFGLLQDPDLGIRNEALIVINHINVETDPAIALPALTQAIGDADTNFAIQALNAIQLYGPDAKPAIPAILDLLHRRESSMGGPNDILRSEIKNVLDQIDPAAARAAGL